MDAIADFFGSVIAVFDFIFSLLQTIINGVSGVASIFVNVIDLINNVVKILPNSLYIITISYISVFGAYLLFKLFRKG